LNLAANNCGTTLGYIKPHGALYNQAAAGPFANLFCSVVQNWEWPVVCLPGSEIEKLCEQLAIGFVSEGFADRRYRPDGSLVPRTEPNAVLHDPREVVDQVEWLVREKAVRTICVHGDTPGAVEFVRKVREALLAKGHIIRAFVE
jgi:5-oxoprolinase (ATP-hydrolysing) subunit A